MPSAGLWPRWIRRWAGWNIGCWPGLLEFLPYVADDLTAGLVRDAMERYTAVAMPLLSELPRQVTDRLRRAAALDIVNFMRDDGVLISTAGADEATLKIRPPLVCAADHVSRFLHLLEAALVTLQGR